MLADMQLARQALRFFTLEHLRFSACDWRDKRHFLVALIGATSVQHHPNVGILLAHEKASHCGL